MRLSRQLLLWLLLPQLVLWLAGGAAAYRLTYSYVEQAQDHALLQSARSLARQLKPIGNGLLIDFPRAAQAILEADPVDRQFYMVSSPPGQFVLGNHTLPPPPQAVMASRQPGTPYFYDGVMPANDPAGTAQPVRVVALYLLLDGEINAPPDWVLVQVARSNNARQQLARRILLDMLLPLSSLVLLMTAVVWLGIRAGLKPLTELTQAVAGRGPADLQPLRLETAPQELHALVRALNSLLEGTRRLVSAQQRFIADAAHQLRTPLAGLKSQTQLALEHPMEPPLRERLLRVHASAERSAHLVGQLLTLARSDPDAAPIRTQRIDLCAQARRWVSEHVPRALKAGIDLGWDEHSTPEPIWIDAEPALLHEALLNVIDNALRYAGAGAEVTVGLQTDATHVTLWVRDNGPGIPPAARERLFERFYRARDDVEGCGLGLPIVRDILRRHGGDVELEHLQPHGLLVRLRLPRPPLNTFKTS